MDFIYFNLDLSLVAYLKAFAFNKNTEREVCYVRSAKIIFSLFLKFPNNSCYNCESKRSGVKGSAFVVFYRAAF